MGFDIAPSTVRSLSELTLTVPGGTPEHLPGDFRHTSTGPITFFPRDGRAPRDAAHFEALVATLYGREGRALSGPELTQALACPDIVSARASYLSGGALPIHFPRHIEPLAMDRPAPAVATPGASAVSPAGSIAPPAAARGTAPTERVMTHSVPTPHVHTGPADLTLPPMALTRFAHVMDTYHSNRAELLARITEYRRQGQGELANRLVFLVERMDTEAANFARSGPGSDSPDMSGAGEMSQLLFAGLCAAGYSPADAAHTSGFTPPPSRDADDPGPTASSPWDANRDLPTERNQMFFWTTPF